MAFAGLELLGAHGGVGGDGEDEIVDLFLALVVVGIGLIADHRIGLIGDKGEGAGAERHLVKLAHLAVGGELVGIFLRHDRGEVHAEVGEERRFRMVEHELDRQVIDLLDRLDQFREAHAGSIFPGGAIDILVPRIVGLELALEGEDHVVGVQLACRGEVFRRLELDALAQLEGVFETVGRNRPALGEAGLKLGAAMLEFDEAAIGGARRSVEGLAAGVQARIETFRRRLGAIDQRLRPCRRRHDRGERGRGEQERELFHDIVSQIVFVLIAQIPKASEPDHLGMERYLPVESNRCGRNFVHTDKIRNFLTRTSVKSK